MAFPDLPGQVLGCFLLRQADRVELSITATADDVLGWSEADVVLGCSANS